MRFRLSTRALASTICLSVIAMVASQPVRAASPLTLKFVTHASFFSEEMHQPKALDPHAFVKDPNAPAATGPQNIEHALTYRPALLNDPPPTPTFTPTRNPLAS